MIQGYSEWMEYQAALLFGNVQGFEQNTLRRIGKRIDKYGRMNSADIKTINNIAAVNEDMDAIVKELATMTDKNIREVYDIYGKAITYMHDQNRPLYDYRGKKFVPFEDNRELQALVRAFAKSTGGTMINLAKTSLLGFTDKSGKFSHLQKAYTDVLDKAVMAVSTGTADFHTAMRDSIVELGGSGLRIQYDTITRRLDTVVRQNLLWGAKQASNEYNEMIGDELGCDGIEIDWHSNPRPSHEFMQGKQYALGGAKTVNGIKFESAGPALKALEDYGCLHYKVSIICGVSEPRYNPEELARLNAQNSKIYEIGDKKMTGYEASQAMRRLETEVRRQKDIRELARASGDKATVKKCNEHIKAVKAKYTEISNITGIPEEARRMSKPRMPKVEENTHYLKGTNTTFKNINGSAPITKQLAKELDTEKANFEQIFGSLDNLSSVKTAKYMNNHYYGEYNDNSGELFLYGVGGDKGKAFMTNVAKQNKKDGVWSTSSPYHVYRHELTHCWLSAQKATAGFEEKLKKVQAIKDEFDFKLLTNPALDGKIEMKNALSSYGLKGNAPIDDFICESVAEYLTANPRNMAKRITEILIGE